MVRTQVNRFAVMILAAFFLASCTEAPVERPHEPASLAEGIWLDLSYAFSEETIYWPTAESFELDTVNYGETPAGFFYAANNFKAAEHGGTHLDAPIHFSAGKQTVDQVPVENLTGPAVRVDVSEMALADRDYLISTADLEAWEAEYGRIPDHAMVLLQTGYGQFWPDAEAYMGTAARGPEALADLHFPGLDPEAAAWLAASRSIRGVGIDTPSIDFGQSTAFEAHQHLAGSNILIFENVANVASVPATGAWLVAAPMKIQGGSGGPARLLAFVPAR
jgi:kynurenine formamidase